MMAEGYNEEPNISDKDHVDDQNGGGQGQMEDEGQGQESTRVETEDRPDSPDTAMGSKSPKHEIYDSKGKYVLRAARHEDPLHFIHRIVQNQAEERDLETEELITVMKSAESNIDQTKDEDIRSLITAALVKQFDNGESEAEEDKDPPPGSTESPAHQRKEGGACATTSVDMHNTHEYSKTVNEIDDDVWVLRAGVEESSSGMEDIAHGHELKNDLHNQDDLYFDLKDDLRLDLEDGLHFDLKEEFSQFDLTYDDLERNTRMDFKVTETEYEEFEQSREEDNEEKEEGKGDGPESPQPISITEEMTTSQSEKESLEVRHESELGDLPAPLPEITKQKAKDNNGSHGDSEIDFNVVENTIPLNTEANKQRMLLRQKGSLAGRRKPTRSSLRTTEATRDLFADTTDSASEPNNTDLLEEGENSDPEDEVTISPLAALKKTKKVPVLLPGFAEISAGKPKLKTAPKPAPTPKSTAPSEERASTPPWMREAKLRKTHVKPRPDVEKTQEEGQGEKPVWMKDALAKRKRVTNYIHNCQDSVKSENEENDDRSRTPSAPWVHETQLRKTTRPLSNRNSDTIDADNRVTKETLTPVKGVHGLRGVLGEQDENQPPHNPVFSSEELPIKHNVLPPIRSSPSIQSTSSTESDSVPQWKAEVAMRRKSKSYIHPVKLDKPITISEVPAWKRELMEKNKHRRESCSSGPEIKQSDISNGKSKKFSNVKYCSTIPTLPNIYNDESTTQNIPPWKLELEKRRKSSAGLHRGLDRQDSRDSQEDDRPEWMRQVAKRKNRLASFIEQTQQSSGET